VQDSLQTLRDHKTRQSYERNASASKTDSICDNSSRRRSRRKAPPQDPSFELVRLVAKSSQLYEYLAGFLALLATITSVFHGAPAVLITLVAAAIFSVQVRRRRRR
jgi:hypothetical protein